MTEKRFTVRYSNVNEYDNIIEDNGRVLTDKEVLDLLNSLNDEIEQLKSDRDYWKTLAESLAKKNGKGGF